MSYRVCAEDVQIFGNNVTRPEWDEFIKSQGIQMDEDGCYDGEITDFMGALDVIENIVMRLAKKSEENRKIKENDATYIKMFGQPKNLFDFSDIPEKYEKYHADGYEPSILDSLMELTQDAYAFMPYTFYKACESKLESLPCYSISGHLRCFKIKDGLSIKVSAG